MHLATRWFGARSRDLDEQFAEAAALGFRGLALLPGSARPSRPWPAADAPARPVAASWELLAPAPAGEPPARCWRVEDLSEVVKSAARLGIRLLLLPVGEEADSQRRARGRRMLERVQSEGSVDAADEALEELATARGLAQERELEQLAALLYAAARAAPGLQIALVPHASPAGLLDPQAFRLLVEELGEAAPLLWHDLAVAEERHALGLEEPGAWLDAWGGRIAGVALQDWAGGQGHLPPGAGQVDWPLLREYLPRETLRVLDLAPSYPGAVLSEARATLVAQGLA